MGKEYNPDFHKSENPCVPYNLLSKRRQEVLRYLSKGYQHEDIARLMGGISTKTIQTLVEQIGKIGQDVYSNNDYKSQSRITIIALIKDGIAQGYIPYEASLDNIQKLTRQETEVMNSLQSGMTSAQISRIFCISPRTAETHVRNIRSKLNVKGTHGGNGDFALIARAEYLELSATPFKHVAKNQ